VDSVSSGYDPISRSATLLSSMPMNPNLTSPTALQQISVIRKRSWTRPVRFGSYTPAPTLASPDPSKPVYLVTGPDGCPTPRSFPPLALVDSSTFRPSVHKFKYYRSGGSTPISPRVATFLFVCPAVRGIPPQPPKHPQEVHRFHARPDGLGCDQR
jgi:hypothetical protein